MRRSLSVIVVAVVGVGSVARAELPRYQVTRVAPGGGDTSGVYPRGINDAGQVVGSVGDSAFLWTPAAGMQTWSVDGTMQAEDISRNGTIVGWAAYTNSAGNKAIVWPGGSDPQLLYAPPGGTSLYTLAYGINDDGTVRVGRFAPNEYPYSRPARFNGETFTPLELPEGSNASEAADVNDAGIIIGVAGIPNAPGGGGARWSADGTLLDVVNGTFDGINNRGQIVGSFGDSAGYWSPTMEFTAIPGHQAIDINDGGAIVAINVSGSSQDYATVHVPGIGTAKLSERLGTHEGSWAFDQARAINNRGQITGWGYFDPDGPEGPLAAVQTGFFLDPIRSPGDTDYDGTVAFDDLLALARNYGSSDSVFWEQEDFDFSGGVDFDDLLTLARHYGTTANANLPDGASAAFAADWALAQSIVPEPSAMIALIGTTALTANRRRRATDAAR